MNLKLPDIRLADISRFRGEHMGFAMIVIVLFHVALPRTDPFFGLRRVGNIGVDIFLFLSGVGLWFSWMKRDDGARNFLSDWWQFYKRRLVRVYPAWLVVACLYYIPRYHGGLALWGKGHGLIDLMGDILVNWDFWLHDELTFWYVPAIMVLYVFAPPYMQLIRRHPEYRWLVVVMVMWTVVQQWVTPVHHAVGHLEIFWSRVPVFFLGINMGEMVRRRQTVDASALWLVLLVAAMSLWCCVFMEQNLHGRFPLFIERLMYIPLVVALLLLLGIVWSRVPAAVAKAVAWVGTVSLEMYLIHAHFVLKHLYRFHLGYWLTFLLTLAIALPLAYVLHIAVEWARRRISP